MIEVRGFHTATRLPNGSVLVAGGAIGGFESLTALASAELYDPSNGSWSATGDMHEGRFDHTATRLPDGTVLVAGGCCGSGYLEPIVSAELFDPSSALWTATRGMIEARGWHTATLLLDGKVLVAGGGGVSGDLSSAELYEPGRGSWTATANMDLVRLDHTATLLLDGKGWW
jgi:hypothetical protein